MRSLIDGLAVEFLFDPTEDHALIAKLRKVLNEYSPASGHHFARKLDDPAAAATLKEKEKSTRKGATGAREFLTIGTFLWDAGEGVVSHGADARPPWYRSSV